MKVHYDKKDKVLVVQLVKKPIDHAYETENMLVHVAKNGEPVLLEIFDSEEFFTQESRSLPSEIKHQYFSVTS